MSASEFHVVLVHARKAEAEALTKLYHLFYPGVANYVLGHVSPNVAEDLISDVFVRMIENLHKVRAEDETSFAAWLHRIAKNVVAGYYRQEKADLRYASSGGDLASFAQYADPEHYAERQEMHEALTEEMNALTEEQRLILHGRFEHGHDTQALAQQIGRDAATVRMLQHRALKRLRRALAARLIVILAILGSLLGFGYTFVRAAQPGSPLYPVRQRLQQLLPASSNPRPQTPTSTPVSIVPKQPTAVPTSTPSPTAVPSTTPASSTPIVSPTSTPAPILGVKANLQILPTATPKAIIGCLKKLCI